MFYIILFKTDYFLSLIEIFAKFIAKLLCLCSNTFKENWIVQEITFRAMRSSKENSFALCFRENQIAPLVSP